MSKLDPNMLKTAEGLGIPLTAIVNYVGELQAYNVSVEARLEGIIQNFKPAVQETVQNMVKEAQAKAQQQIATVQAQAPAAPAGPLGSLASLAPLLGQLAPLLGTVNQDPFTEMAKKQFMDNALMSQNFMSAFMQNIMSKLGSKAATEIVDAIPVVAAK